MHCTNCGKEVPAQAEFCIECGTRIQTASPVPSKKRSGWNWALGILVALVVLGGLLPEPDEPKATKPETSTEEQSKLAGLKWYEGGTLHQKTVAEWQAASNRDRLATSSDFVAKIRKFDSLADMLVAAHVMQTCITIADEGVQHLKVSEIAASCAQVEGREFFDP